MPETAYSTPMALNRVWDIGLLDWVPMEQPIIDGSSVTIEGEIDVTDRAGRLLGHVSVDLLPSTSATGTLAANGDAVSVVCTNIGALTLEQPSFGGGFDGTLNFEASNNGGTTWRAIQGLREGNMTLAFTDGPELTYMRRFNVAGYTNFRVRLSGRTAGSCTIKLVGESLSQLIQSTVTLFGAGASGVGAIVNPLGGLHTTIYNESGVAADVNTTSPAAGAAGLVVREVRAGQDTMANSRPVVVASDQSAIPVSAASLPLPTGAATAARQDIGNASLAAIDADLDVALSTRAAESTLQDVRTSVQTMDDWDESDRAKVNPIAGQAGVQGGSGAVTALTQRVVAATDQAVVQSASTVLDADNEAITISLDGAPAATLTVQGDTTISTVFALEATADDSSWHTIWGLLNDSTWLSGTFSSSQVANPDVVQLFPGVGDIKVRVRIAIYTAGAFTGQLTASPVPAAVQLRRTEKTPGSSFTTNNYMEGVGGADVNSGIARALPIAATTPTSGQNGVVTREVARGQATMANSIPTVLASDQSALIANLSTSNIIGVSFNESVAAPTAATWYLKRQFARPANTVMIPHACWSVVTTAGSRSMIGIINRLATFNVNTDAFAAVNSVAAPYHYARMFIVVTTALSATPTNVTVTYTDELGNSAAAAAVTVPASAPAGNCFEVPLNATTGQMRDVGVRAVTNVTDSAAPAAGVVEIWGVTPLLDALGPANTMDVTNPMWGELNSNEQIAIFLMQAATTAQQRGAGFSCFIR